MEECGICFSETPQSPVVTTCTHHFCCQCLRNWCKRSGGECPLCRKRVYTYFHTDRMELEKGIFDIQTVVNFASSPASITLKNNYPGVLICKLGGKGAFARQGLMVGDVILKINNVNLICHQQAIELIKESEKKKDAVSVVFVEAAELRV